MWGDSAFRRARRLIESQKGMIRDLVEKQHSLSDELQGMCVLATGKNKEIEDLKYKLQINRDEIGRMAEAVNINHAEIIRLKAELKVAKECVDPYYEARFRNECEKTQELSKKVWKQDGELETLRKAYDALYAREQRALELLHQYQSSGTSLEILSTGLHDLNVRVGKLEALLEGEIE